MIRALVASLVLLSAGSTPPPDAGAFSAWLEDLEALPPPARGLAIERRITAAGGTPLVEGLDVLFLVRGDTPHPPRIVADFNAWGWRPEGFDRQAGRMTRVAGTDWFWLHTPLLPAARIEYQIARGDDDFEVDQRNPLRVEGFGGLSSEVRMAGYAPPPEVEAHPDLPSGRVERHELTSAILGGRRTIYVYLPYGYDDGTSRLPVAYFGDGNSYLTQARVPVILDNAIGARRIRPLIAVLVDPIDRRDEYGMNPAFRRMMAEEIIPFVDARYRTDARREGRIVLGGSRGGMMALDLAIARDDLVAYAAAYAPAALPFDLAGAIRREPHKDVRIWMLVGLYDVRWLEDGRALRDALRARGYALTYVEIPEGHNIPAWRAYIDDALRSFVPAGTVPGGQRARATAAPRYHAHRRH